jgi:WD40 repeat protein
MLLSRRYNAELVGSICPQALRARSNDVCSLCVHKLFPLFSDHSTSLLMLPQYHSDAITSFACSRDGTLVATGQLGHRPTVSIWDTRTCTTRYVVPEVQLHAVSCVAFSSDKGS